MQVSKFARPAKWLILLAILLVGLGILGLANIIFVEVRFRGDLSHIKRSTTRQELIDLFGAPDDYGSWTDGREGTHVFEYRYPYLWDYVLSVGNTRTIEVTYRHGEDEVFHAWTRHHYSDTYTDVISRPDP